MTADDLVIADAVDEAEFWKQKYVQERTVTQVFHELAVASFDALHESERRHRREREERARLEDELQRLRADLMLEGL